MLNKTAALNVFLQRRLLKKKLRYKCLANHFRAAALKNIQLKSIKVVFLVALQIFQGNTKVCLSGNLPIQELPPFSYS